MASFPASLTNLMVRKRPGFNDSATHSQPLDLSVPKQKVTMDLDVIKMAYIKRMYQR